MTNTKMPIYRMIVPTPGVEEILIFYGYDLVCVEYLLEPTKENVLYTPVQELIGFADAPELAALYDPSTGEWNHDMASALVTHLDHNDIRLQYLEAYT